jgi:hypothetical protein
LRETDLTGRRFGAYNTPLFHKRQETIEEITTVVRAGRGLRMVLHREDWQRAVFYAFDRAVVQVHVRESQVGGTGDFAVLPYLDREAVVL